ncbi:hypothetical protein HMPREF2141_02554 [Bacteroides uniformis]|nr:hypothetical protein HMPREF2141_02554 [Bacteroides uniformis]
MRTVAVFVLPYAIKKEVAQRAADESRLFVFPCLIRHLVIIT